MLEHEALMHENIDNHFIIIGSGSMHTPYPFFSQNTPPIIPPYSGPGFITISNVSFQIFISCI